MVAVTFRSRTQVTIIHHLGQIYTWVNTGGTRFSFVGSQHLANNNTGLSPYNNMSKESSCWYMIQNKGEIWAGWLNKIFCSLWVFSFRLRTSGTPLYQLSSGQPQVYRVSKTKLRDIQQECKGTSLNYFKVFFYQSNNFLGLSRSIMLYLGLS